jgi:membrane-associated protease RseP (regulator of RpoE activity)
MTICSEVYRATKVLLSVALKCAALASLVGSATAQLASMVSGCPAPSYFGICDPYVPGVFIRPGDKGTISVVSTWHDGPAEKAGICPGDKIVAVDEAVAGDSSWDRLVRKLVSNSPTPVALRVQRRAQEFELRVPRVRETAVSALSGERFLSAISSTIPKLPHYYPIVAAEGVTPDNLAALIEFRKRMLRSAGSKPPPAIDKPVPEPPEHEDDYLIGIAAIYAEQRHEAMVAGVLFPSPAFNARVYPGDLIVSIQGTSVAKLSRIQLIAALAPADSKPLSVTLTRLGKRLTIRLIPVRYKDALAGIGRKLGKFGPSPQHCPDS